MSINVEDVYQRVIVVANFFLKQASGLSIDGLKELDPTVEEIAKDLRTLAGLIKALAGDSYDDENMAINAFQCCIVMERIALCVQNEDEQELVRSVEMLDMHVSVP